MAPSLSAPAVASPEFPLALSRTALAKATSRTLHAPRNNSKAIVSLVQAEEAHAQLAPFVVKDLRARSWAFRVLWGRRLLAREWKALAFLSGTEGVPAPLSRIDADAFAMSFCQGDSVMPLAPGELPASAVENLERLIHRVHALGVTHGDLHRDNILLDETGRVCIIDWATACVFGVAPKGLKSWTWREWQALDLRALAKIKARHAPQLLRPDERQRLENGGTALSRAVRRVGAFCKGKGRKR